MNKQRLQRVLDNMEAQGLDQILVTSTASVFYLTGYWIEPHERMLALYIDKNGRTALYGNEIFGVEATADLPVIPHADSADPVADLAAALAPGRLGVDKFWPSKFLIGIMEHRPDIRPVLGSGPIDAARRYQDEAERDALRRASKINDIVVETAIGALALYISDQSVADFQPMNINFGLIPPLDHRVKGKRNKNAEISRRALERLGELDLS